MSTVAELARENTDLEPAAIDHLGRLVQSWGMLADLCFSDLLLMAPATKRGGRPGTSFVVLGQVRPSTSQTLHRDDLVGRIVDEVERPVVARAWRLAEIVEGEITVEFGERARVQCIPVRWKGQLLAVLARENAIVVGRRQPGELEKVYVATFDRLARMIVAGEFPFASTEIGTRGLARVSDGAVVLDPHRRVEWASPNAVNALHRMGNYANAEGMRLDELGIEETVVRTAFMTKGPQTEEIDRREVTLNLLVIPLLDGGKVTGALVLVRDVTAIRSLDRLLLSKDAAIREVHHRVKNNLQTISSLLRLQARRLNRGEGREQLEEAQRRVRSIAIVHDILSRDPADQVAFHLIVRELVRMAEEGVLGGRVEFAVEGDAGELPALIATPLAMVVSELLQNAVEHGFETMKPDARVLLRLANEDLLLSVDVIDNGQGFPPDFRLEQSGSLGLAIVHDLVRTQLGGTIDITPADDGQGTMVRLEIPIPEDISDTPSSLTTGE